MNEKKQSKYLTFGISTLALVVFPLLWFLSQAILFRELTEQLARNIVVLIAIPFGSTFIFLLFLGMNKLIHLAPKDTRDSLEARMFVGPSLFMIGLFLFYPSLRTIFLSFKDRYSQEFVGFDNYLWAFTDAEMITTIRNQIIWLISVVILTLLIGLVVGWLTDRLNKGEAFFKSIVFICSPLNEEKIGANWGRVSSVISMSFCANKARSTGNNMATSPMAENRTTAICRGRWLTNYF